MRRVVKLGGSLLNCDDLVERFSEFMVRSSDDANEPVETLLVVGGGALVDAIRAIDRVRPGDPEAIHWMCVDLMDTTLSVVRDLFPHWKFVGSPTELRDCIVGGFETFVPNFVAVSSYYGRDTTSPLPCDWRTTSDSIAAELAMRVDADELVLLKSCDVDPKSSLEDLAAQAIIDEALPTICRHVRQLRIQKL